MGKVDYALELKPLLGVIYECGDLGFIKEYDNQCFMALIDVLGHGSEARTVALLAEKYLEENYKEDLICIMKGLHRHIGGTRGAVVSLCRLDMETGKLIHVGIGNITVRIFGKNPSRLVSRDGIVGYGSIRPHGKETAIMPGDVLLMHSDGIKEHFDIIECPGLVNEEAKVIARGIMSRYGIKKDDASCIALKYLK